MPKKNAPPLDVRELNRLHNVYKKEADEHGIGSPYRIDEYTQYRMKGMSVEDALERVRSSSLTKRG